MSCEFYSHTCFLYFDHSDISSYSTSRNIIWNIFTEKYYLEWKSQRRINCIPQVITFTSALLILFTFQMHHHKTNTKSTVTHQKSNTIVFDGCPAQNTNLIYSRALPHVTEKSSMLWKVSVLFERDIHQHSF